MNVPSRIAFANATLETTKKIRKTIIYKHTVKIKSLKPKKNIYLPFIREKKNMTKHNNNSCTAKLI